MAALKGRSASAHLSYRAPPTANETTNHQPLYNFPDKLYEFSLPSGIAVVIGGA
jgi:hypothetical protein